MTCDRCLAGRHVLCPCGCTLCATARRERGLDDGAAPVKPTMAERRRTYRLVDATVGAANHVGSDTLRSAGRRLYVDRDTAEAEGARPCAACREVLPVDAFHRYPNGKLRSRCKACTLAERRERAARATAFDAA